MVSIGSYTALARTAARGYASAAREQARVSDQLGRTGPDFRNNAVTAGLTRKLESQVGAWDHAAKMNRLSLDKIDTIQAYNDIFLDRTIRARDAALVAGRSGSTQADRDIARDEIISLQEQNQADAQVFNLSGGLVDIYTDGNGWDVLSNRRIISIYGADANQTDYISFNIKPVSINPGFVSGVSYTENQMNVSLFMQTALDYQLSGSRADADDIPHHFKNGYINGGQSFLGAQAAALNVAQSFAEKMSDTLSIGIDRLNAIDYETQSHYLAQAQAQKDLALSGMSIANQAQQAYVQALQRTNQSVGQLMKFYV